MVSSLARFRHILAAKPDADAPLSYVDAVPPHGELFPTFTKAIYDKVFRPVVHDARLTDDAPIDPETLLQPCGERVGTGRLGTTVTAIKKDMIKYPAGAAPVADLQQKVALTKIDAAKIDYLEAVRCVSLHKVLHRDFTPFMCKVLLSFKSMLPYMKEYYYIVSEYWAKGTSLCKRLGTIGTFPEPDARYYLMQLADALISLHSHGLIVRRLCLCQLLLTPTGYLRVAPYTRCELSGDCGQPCNLLDQRCGDQFYCSPEVVFGVDVQPAADWWSFGVIACQMLTGQLPFSGRTLGELGKAITEAPVTLPGSQSPEAKALIKQLLHKDPRRRLGWGADGAQAVMAHPWFRGAEWKDVRDTNNLPPYMPIEDDAAVFPQKPLKAQADVDVKRHILDAKLKGGLDKKCVKPPRLSQVK